MVGSEDDEEDNQESENDNGDHHDKTKDDEEDNQEPEKDNEDHDDKNSTDNNNPGDDKQKDHTLQTAYAPIALNCKISTILDPNL